MVKFLHIGMDGMNLPLLKRFMAEGELPTFQRLIERGTINRLMPSIAAWTPTNWAAQVTGAHPGIHGLGGWTKHHKTDPMDVPLVESWESREWQGETVWQVAEEAGYKCLVTHYPVGVWPSPIEEGYIVAPGFRYPPFVIANQGEYYASPSVGLSADECEGERERSVDEVEEGGPPGATPVRLQRALGWRNLDAAFPEGAWAGELRFALKAGGEQTLYLLAKAGERERVWVYETKDASQPLLEVELGRWSPFTQLEFGETAGQTGTVRLRLLALEPGPTVHLCRSQVYATSGWSYPESLS